MGEELSPHHSGLSPPTPSKQRRGPLPLGPGTQVSPDPIGELQGIGDCGAQEDDGDVVREHDEHLLPHDPTLHTR